MTSRSNAAPGRFGLLDGVVLIAMAVTATAFAAGLIINSGIDMMAGIIAGAALFVVMASSQYVITRQARSATVAGRLDELEEALVVLDGDLQRIDQVEDDVARLDLLTDRVERLDRSMVHRDPREEPSERVDQLSADFEALHTRLDALRVDLEGEARAQREKIAGELRMLEGLFKQLASDLTAATTNGASSGSGEAYRAQTALPPIPSEDASDDEEVVTVLRAIVRTDVEADPEAEQDDRQATQIEPQAAQDDNQTTQEEAKAEEPVILVAETLILTEPLDQEESVEEIVELGEPASVNAGVILQAIKERSVELHLQPVFDLGTRQVRYLEALTRLRTESDELVPPDDFIPVAEAEGVMPQVDNM